MRRFKDLLALHTGDLGGAEIASESEKAIIRRACTLMVELERREMLFAQAGEASDLQLEVYQRSANTLRRLLQAIGLQRRPRDVTPSLGALIRADQEAERERLAEEHKRRNGDAEAAE